jgi:hypothetical protein
MNSSFLSKNAHRLLMGVLFMFLSFVSFSQVTSGGISGVVVDEKGEGLPGATVVAIHVPSGTRYGTITEISGDYNLPSCRVGGPYTVTFSFVGFKDQTLENIAVGLGNSTAVNVTLSESASQLQEVLVTANKFDLVNSKKTGASATLGRDAINNLPTLGRTINDITKYNAYSNGRSFGGQDQRFNNFTIDGAAFNNGFGLGSQAQAGGRTGSSAISIDALEEVQINIAPFDVRQSGFSGAGINAVTRSGTNQLSGSVFGFAKNQTFLGTKIDTFTVTAPKFDESTFGFRLGGPIVKNKVFFFVNAEYTQRSQPALDWVANRPGATGNVSTVSADSLEQLSKFMKEKFNYETGPYENFNNDNTSLKYLARIDWNINDKHKLALRYAHHDSKSDVIISNSASAGNGNRTNSNQALSFQNSGYIIQDNTRSVVAELNSTFSSKISNTFIATFNYQNEDRGYRTAVFPLIDILKPGTQVTTTATGMDPFTPGNKLSYNTFNVTDNLSYFVGKHNIVLGAGYEYFKSNNLFFPSSNGVYIYNSFADFFKAGQAAIDAPNATTSVVPVRFQYRYSGLPNFEEPLQVLEVNKFSAYAQDEFRVLPNLKLTAGVRGEVFDYANTAIENPIISKQTFKLPDGTSTNVNTGALPKARLLVSPRLGFNLDVFNNQKTQVRGGTGIFVSSIPYVWVSNQVGNNGILSGFLPLTNVPFATDPSRFRPANGLNINDPKLVFSINSTTPDFKMPQVWKSNLAIDQRIWGGFVATLEGIYNKNIQAIRHANINQEAPTAKFAGVDNRSRFPGSGAARSGLRDTLNRINDNVVENIALLNTSQGDFYSITAKIEKPISRNWGGMLGYTYSKATDLANAGATAFESYASITAVNGSNAPTLSFANNDLRHRFVGFANYRLGYGNQFGGSLMLTLGFTSQSGPKFSYAINGDMNGDGVNNNELLFVPNAASDLKFADIKSGSTVVYTAAQQTEAFEKFITQSEYLSSRRGTYAERNGAENPWLNRIDFAAEKDFYIKVGGTKNTLRFRFDIFNLGNLFSNTAGVFQTTTTIRPLNFSTVDAAGNPVYTLPTQVENGKTILLKDSFVKQITTDNVWQMQFGIRYIFN